MHCLSSMPQDSNHVKILKHSIAVAQEHPSCGNLAGGIVKQYGRLGMALPSSFVDLNCLNSHSSQANMEGQLCKLWDGLHVSGRIAPSRRAKALHMFADGFCALVEDCTAYFQATAGDFT